MEWMIGPAVGELNLPAFKQHHRGVNTTIASGNETASQSLEILVVETREIELRLAVVRHTGTGSRPGMRAAVLHLVAGKAVRPFRHLPSPHPEEVVIVPFEKAKIGVVIEHWGRVRYGSADDQAVVL
jgi:hypothetical protein